MFIPPRASQDHVLHAGRLLHAFDSLSKPLSKYREARAALFYLCSINLLQEQARVFDLAVLTLLCIASGRYQFVKNILL